MSPLRRPLLVLLSLAASTFGEAPHAAADREALLTGVPQIIAPGVPGAVSAFGPAAFAVVAGNEGRNIRSAVIAAGRCEKGRVVALGHDGYLTATSDADTARMLFNGVRWAGGNRDGLKVIVDAPSELLDYLRTQGLEASAAGNSLRIDSVKNADVLCLDARRLRSAEQIPAIANWIRSGGGLIVAGTGWGWASLNPGKDLATDFLANQLLAPAGIVFAGGTPTRTTENGYRTGTEGLSLLNASSALDALLDRSPQKQGVAPETVSQASATVAEAIRSVPSTDSILLPRLTRLRSGSAPVIPTSENPVTSSDAAARLLLTLDVQEAKSAQGVRPHPAADAFPGRLPPGASRLQDQVITVDTSIRDWHSTGLYAAPGESISITIPALAKDKGLAVRIGCHSDKLWHHEKWQRVPEITTVTQLRAETTTAASPYGGLIYIVVPRGCSLGKLKVSISGAVQAPRFTLNQSTAEQWRMQARQAPAPWAELESSKVILTVPSSVIRDLDDPETVLRFWDSSLDAIAKLAGIDPVRERPERIVTDVQISAGYMHSGYPIMTHLDVADRAVNLEQLKSGGWGFWHELGHNHQVPDWTFNGTGEVTCNLFSLYISELICGIAAGQGHDAMAPDKVASRLKKHLSTRSVFERWKADPFLALTMYNQLRAEFGWETYRKVFAEYRDLKTGERPKSDDEKRDQWMVRFSRAAGKNLGPFFQAWGVPTSDAARAAIAHLPAWMPADWPKPGSELRVDR